MTSQLKKFIERASDLPMQLHRNYKLLRELDEQVCQQQQEVHQQLNQLFNESAPSPPAAETDRPTKRARLAAAAAAAAAIGPIDSTLKAEVEAKLQSIIALGDEKVATANQIYEIINSQIEQLDADLRSFETELSADQAKLGLEVDRDSACQALGVPLDPNMPEQTSDRKKKGGRRKGAAAAAAAAAAVPVVTTAVGGIPLEADASEPCYCVCQRPSFGEMVGCDSDDCPIEWFHYSCMGLTEGPKGEWFCPACKPELWKDKPGLIKAAQKL